MTAKPDDTDDESEDDGDEDENETKESDQSIYSNLIKSFCTML